jgi:hypothetical protein
LRNYCTPKKTTLRKRQEKNVNAPGIKAIVGLVLVLSACATHGDGDDPAPAQASQQRLCGSAETFSCVERMGEPQRCFCADKDTLRELFDPIKMH